MELSQKTENTLREKSSSFHRSGELIIALEKKFNEVKLQLTSIAERLNVEFEIRINDLVNETPNPDFDEAVLESNVNQLRDRIQHFGTINPMAIEAYDEIS